MSVQTLTKDERRILGRSSPLGKQRREGRKNVKKANGTNGDHLAGDAGMRHQEGAHLVVGRD